MKHPSALPRQWRPREKLLRYGAGSLTDRELWMCILGMGRPGKPVQKLAAWVVRGTQSGELSSPERVRTELGESQTARVLAVQELLQRRQQKRQFRILSVQDVLLVVQELAQSRQEQILCLYLSASNELLHTEKIALGTLNAALLHPRDLFFPIRFQPVAHIVVCHNHPSQLTEPSGEDTVFTKRVEAACELLGITLYNHVIVGKETHFSFREAGLLKEMKSPLLADL